MTPRPHHELRILHALGHEIEYRDSCGDWNCTDHPLWHLDTEYRVRPEPTPAPKPDIVESVRLGRTIGGINSVGFMQGPPNLSLTFDGTTGTLKSADVLKPSE